MQNSTLLLLIYVLITLIYWLVSLRIYEKQLFVDSNSHLGVFIIYGGLFWPLWLWLYFLRDSGQFVSKILKKMHDIKY